jgi:hypothetical protein
MTPAYIATPALSMEDVRRRNRRLTLWLVIGVLIALFGGGSYIIVQALGGEALPPLPPAPPHGVLLQSMSEADMVEGNYITTSVLYRTSETPAQVVNFYTNALRSHAPQVSDFQDMMTTTLPIAAPDALQNIPPVFTIPGQKDPYAAKYLYTEYSEESSDIGIAIDERTPRGPTLVYFEQLDQPGD